MHVGGRYHARGSGRVFSKARHAGWETERAAAQLPTIASVGQEEPQSGSPSGTIAYWYTESQAPLKVPYRLYWRTGPEK